MTRPYDGPYATFFRFRSEVSCFACGSKEHWPWVRFRCQAVCHWATLKALKFKGTQTSQAFFTKKHIFPALSCIFSHCPTFFGWLTHTGPQALPSMPPMKGPALSSKQHGDALGAASAALAAASFGCWRYSTHLQPIFNPSL